jgi:phage RecT family recombinase
MTTSSTAIAVERARPTRLDAYLAEVLPPEKKEALFRGLPKHIRPELFERNFANAIMANPDLLKCDPREVYKVVAEIAALGLMLDPQLGEAWIIVGWNSKAGRHSPQRRVGYRGLIKLARNTGEVGTIYAREVCEADHFDADLYTNRITHKADLFGERGPIIGFYAVVRYKDGSEDFEPMSIQEVERIRDRTSDSWKAWKSGKIKREPIWDTDLGEMGKKTVLRRLMKRVPQSPEIADELRDELPAPEQPVELSPPRGRPRLAAALQEAAQGRPPIQEPDQPQEPPQEPQEPPEDDGEYDDGARQGDDGMGYDTREEKRIDTGRRDDEEGEPAAMDADRKRIFDAGLKAAEQGPQKLKFWRAKQMPDELNRLTPDDIAELEAVAKAVKKEPT